MLRTERRDGGLLPPPESPLEILISYARARASRPLAAAYACDLRLRLLRLVYFLFQSSSLLLFPGLRLEIRVVVACRGARGGLTAEARTCRFAPRIAGGVRPCAWRRGRFWNAGRAVLPASARIRIESRFIRAAARADVDTHTYSRCVHHVGVFGRHQRRRQREMGTATARTGEVSQRPQGRARSPEGRVTGAEDAGALSVARALHRRSGARARFRSDREL